MIDYSQTPVKDITVKPVSYDPYLHDDPVHHGQFSNHPELFSLFHPALCSHPVTPQTFGQSLFMQSFP